MHLGPDDRARLHRVVASVVIPTHSAAAAADILEAHPEVEQRTSVYFDETLKVLVLLDFPVVSEDRLNTYLKALELRIDAWVVPSENGGVQSPVNGISARELIASQLVSNLADPITIVKQDSDDDEIRLQLVWELQIALGRPRTRSSNQVIIFVPVATISSNDDDIDEDEYLEPFVPLEPNVLQPLVNLSGAELAYLPLSRLEKVIPDLPKKANIIRLMHVPSSPIHVYAAFMPRLKYNKVNTFLPEPTTIATLDIEMIPIASVEGTIEAIDVSMATGKAVSLMPHSLPMKCRSKDCISFLYDLQSPHLSTDLAESANHHIQAISSPSVDVLCISILIRLVISPITTAILTTSWSTNVDFSQALNPAFGAPSQTIQRTNRPSSLNFIPYRDPAKPKARDRAGTVGTRTASTSLQYQMIPTSIPHQPPISILSISFIASDEPAQVGVPFSWRVLVVNNSDKPAKIAIVPLPRIQRSANATQHSAKRHAPKASNSMLPATATSHTAISSMADTNRYPRNGRAGSTAKAVVEDHVLYALHHQAPSAGAAAVPSETDLISLTAELRIGPLDVRQCHEAEIRFMAYKPGVFRIDAIRVVDLKREVEGGIGAINDIRELPEVVVAEAENE